MSRVVLCIRAKHSFRINGDSSLPWRSESKSEWNLSAREEEEHMYSMGGMSRPLSHYKYVTVVETDQTNKDRFGYMTLSNASKDAKPCNDAGAILTLSTTYQ